MKAAKWYDDGELTAALPFRYRGYAAYSRLFGDRSTRRVPGGSFLLRVLRRIDRAASLETTAPIHGLDGLVVMADLADERILDVIHEIRGENPEYRVMQRLLSEGDTFMDIGANFGTFSLLASRIVGETGKVIAIEPQPRLVDFIEESARRSHALNISVIRRACTEEAEVLLLVPEDDTGRAGFFEAFSGKGRNTSIAAPGTTLDQISESIPPSGKVLVKIDVEGSELAVLRSGRGFIEARRPALIVEINPWSARAAGFSPRDLIDELVELGYSKFSYVADYPQTVDHGAINITRQSNVVAV